MTSRNRKAAVALCALAATALVAATALAAVRVYSNDFSKRADAKELRIAGKGCSKEWNRKHERLLIVARKGPATCRLTLPVRGDAPQPDHIVKLMTRLRKPAGKSAMAKKPSKSTYIGVSVRDGKGGYYELRIYPELRRYELVRVPKGDGFPLQDRDPEKVGKAGERNVLRIDAMRDSVRGRVNGKRVGPVHDADASDREGTRIAIRLGVRGKSSVPVSASIDDLEVLVPDP